VTCGHVPVVNVIGRDRGVNVFPIMDVLRLGNAANAHGSRKLPVNMRNISVHGDEGIE
jgi:hypothetical protein